jgi:hypothetical protein
MRAVDGVTGVRRIRGLTRFESGRECRGLRRRRLEEELSSSSSSSGTIQRVGMSN